MSSKFLVYVVALFLSLWGTPLFSETDPYEQRIAERIAECKKLLKPYYSEKDLNYLGKGGEGVVFGVRGEKLVVKVYDQPIGVIDALNVFRLLNGIKSRTLSKYMRFIDPRKGKHERVFLYEDPPGEILNHFSDQPDVLLNFDQAIDQFLRALNRKYKVNSRVLTGKYENRHIFFGRRDSHDIKDHGAVGFRLHNFKYDSKTGIFYLLDVK